MGMNTNEPLYGQVWFLKPLEVTVCLANQAICSLDNFVVRILYPHAEMCYWVWSTIV